MQQFAGNAQRMPTFDAIVVGSGATGGWAAKKLTEAGMQVALLEAGKKITPSDFTEHKQPWEMPYLGMAQARDPERSANSGNVLTRAPKPITNGS